MKYDTLPGEIDKDVKDRALTYAMLTLNIPEFERHSALERRDVRRIVSDYMVERVKGRPLPQKPFKFNPSKEGIRLMKVSLFHNTYPRNITTGIEKFRYLRNLHETGQIADSLYKEMLDSIGYTKSGNKSKKSKKEEFIAEDLFAEF